MILRALQAGRLLIPSRLRDARKVGRLSQTELAERIGVSRQAVSAYERGDKSPEPATFQKIAGILQQPVAFFTNGDGAAFGASTTKFFRKFGPDTARRNDACDVLGEWFVQTARYLDGYVNYPIPALLEATHRCRLSTVAGSQTQPGDLAGETAFIEPARLITDESCG